MDGLDVTVVVLGQKGVGKMTFIAHCLGLPQEAMSQTMQQAVNICGWDVRIKMVKNPNQLVPATIVIILFDLTNEDSFQQLNESLELAQRVSPTAMRAVVGTKADLHGDRKISSMDAVAFCQRRCDGSSPMPYYETALHPQDSIFNAFQEVLARPLINEYVIKADTEQEVLTFVHETMGWCLQNQNANILTHLRDLGYSVPPELIEHHPETMREYLFTEYPLRVVPKFSHVELGELEASDEDDLLSLEEYEEPLNVVDSRSTLELLKSYHLMWKDISLTYFSKLFLDHLSVPKQEITHIDLSYNYLTSVPAQLFQLPLLESLDISHNELTSLPSIELWNTESRLQILNASHNALGGDNASPLLYRKHGGNSQTPFGYLWYVDLSYNKLASFPLWVLHFPGLKYLNIQHNIKIRKLPLELCRMEQLVSIVTTGLTLHDPPPVVTSWGPIELLRYLRLKQRSTVPWNSMRVVLVGPRGAGKTTLSAKLRGEGGLNLTPTKGLEVTEWKYRGTEIFTFRNKWCVFDLWDFTGDPEYQCIYSCFTCATSLHLVVCDARNGTSDLIRWLSDIQSTSAERIPVIVVFTHMDFFRSRENIQDFRRRMTQWLEYNNKRFDTSNGAFSLIASMTETIKSLQGEEMLSSYEPPPEAFQLQEVCGDIVPLMPLVLRVAFVNNVTGDGIQSLRKLLYKMASGVLPPGVSDFTGLQIMGAEIPTRYYHVEQLVRQLRNKFRSSRREGEQKPFYTITELMDKLKRPLSELHIREKDFTAALKFLHEFGFVHLHECHENKAILVGVDPQLIGYLLQRMIKAGLVTKEVQPHSSHLPNSHLFMLWGVEPIWSVDLDSDTIYSHHLLDYLYYLNICTPLLPGITMIPFLLTPALMRGQEPDATSLTPRRVYILGYLPSMFSSQLTNRVLSALVEACSTGISPPTSPGNVTNFKATVPLVMPSGMKLYLWQRNIFIEDSDGSKMWVRVSEGKQVGPESFPYTGRVDIFLEAKFEKEATLLRLVTQEIDYLLEHVYPALLDADQTPQQVEIFVPLNSEWASGDDTALLIDDEAPVQINGNPGQNIRANVSFLSTQSAIAGSPLEQQSDNSSWEILSKQSTTSARLSMIQDCSSSYCLVPLWECIQEAFRTPLIRMNNNKIFLPKMVPDLLYADLPQELIYRTSMAEQFLTSLDDSLVSLPIPRKDVSGLFVRHYYTSEQDDIYVRKPAGALKTFCLKQFLESARHNLLKLQQIRCPYLVSAVGLDFCPPSLALESAPLGTLRSMLRNKRGKLSRDVVHLISLQLLSALEYLHGQELNYHSLSSDNILLWSLNPVSIKLSDAGITHSPSGCELCSYLRAVPGKDKRWTTACRIDYISLGLLVYEMAAGRRPYEDVYTLGIVVLALLNDKLDLSIEAEMRSQLEQRGEEDPCCRVVGCHRLCLQSTMDECIKTSPVSVNILGARFSLCASDHQWSPMRVTLNVECMICSENADLVYWASGSRGLVTGTLEPSTGTLNSNVLQEAPMPESGMFANRRVKPVPIAIGRATVLALVQVTQQLWVGTENGLMGSVYVFNLPEMRRHHYIHLQDAVLSLSAINDAGIKFGGDGMKYRVLVGLANGTIILFLGVHNGKVLENPLQGPKLVVVTHGRKPCLSMNLTPDGYIWCSCGDTMEVLDMVSLKSVQRFTTQASPGEKVAAKGDVITLMAVSSRGVWTVSRRSPVLRLWNQINGHLKASYSIRNIVSGEDDITSLAVQGGAVWLGTRNGYIFLLDASAMEDRSEPLLGLQFCGDGRVKSIVPLVPKRGVTAKLQVVCSLEYPDEVSGSLMTWEYQSQQPWRPKKHTVASRATSVSPSRATNISRRHLPVEPSSPCKSI